MIFGLIAMKNNDMQVKILTKIVSTLKYNIKLGKD